MVTLLYSHMHIYADSCRINIKTQQWRKRGDFLKKIYLSLNFNVCVWEGAGDRTELQYIDPHFYGRQRCVFLVLQVCSTGGPEAHSSRCGLSLPHLVTNGSPNSIESPEGLFGRVWLSLPHLVSNSSGPQLTDSTQLYNSSISHPIAHAIFGMACLIVIKRK